MPHTTSENLHGDCALGFGVWDLGFGVWGLGFWALGLGYVF